MRRFFFTCNHARSLYRNSIASRGKNRLIPEYIDHIKKTKVKYRGDFRMGIVHTYRQNIVRRVRSTRRVETDGAINRNIYR